MDSDPSRRMERCGHLQLFLDGDDLEIHLIYELMPVVPEPVDTDGENEETEENDTPFVSVVSTVLTVGLAVAFIRTGRQAR